MADLITYRPGLGGGVNTIRQPHDIDQDDTPFCNGYLIRKGRIEGFPYFGQPSIGVGTLLHSPALFILNFEPQTSNLGAPYLVMYDGTNLDQFGVSGASAWTNVGASPNPSAGFPIDPVVYNNVLYFPSGPALVSWDGTTFTGAVANSFGGMFIDKLSAHLLLMNTIEVGPVYFPFRIRWSGSGAPNNWNPATDLTSGFIDLDLPFITGYVNNGSYGVLTGPNSLLQVNPTGAGQNPFQIIPWSGSKSFKGIGNKWPWTLDGNGSVSFFVGEDDVYQISPYGLQGVGGKAINAIFDDINSNSTNGIASWSPYFDNGSGSSYPVIIGSYLPYITFLDTAQTLINKYLCYILAIPHGVQTVNGDTSTTILWIYSIADNAWTRVVINGWLTCKISNIIVPPALYNSTARTNGEFGLTYTAMVTRSSRNPT